PVGGAGGGASDPAPAGGRAAPHHLSNAGPRGAARGNRPHGPPDRSAEWLDARRRALSARQHRIQRQLHRERDGRDALVVVAAGELRLLGGGAGLSRLEKRWRAHGLSEPRARRTANCDRLARCPSRRAAPLPRGTRRAVLASALRDRWRIPRGTRGAVGRSARALL